jgi:hypothetical protein
VGLALCRRVLLAEDRQWRAWWWNNRFKNAWQPVFHFCRQQQIKFRPKRVGHQSEDCFDYSPNNPTSKSGSGLLGTGARGDAAGKANAADADGRYAGIARPSTSSR